MSLLGRSFSRHLPLMSISASRHPARNADSLLLESVEFNHLSKRIRCFSVIVSYRLGLVGLMPVLPWGIAPPGQTGDQEPAAHIAKATNPQKIRTRTRKLTSWSRRSRHIGCLRFGFRFRLIQPINVPLQDGSRSPREFTPGDESPVPQFLEPVQSLFGFEWVHILFSVRLDGLMPVLPQSVMPWGRPGTSWL